MQGWCKLISLLMIYLISCLSATIYGFLMVITGIYYPIAITSVSHLYNTPTTTPALSQRWLFG